MTRRIKLECGWSRSIELDVPGLRTCKTQSEGRVRAATKVNLEALHREEIRKSNTGRFR